MFAGPTISADQVREIVPWAEIHSPLTRGDLLSLADSPPDTTLVIDGVFSGTSSPPVSEFQEFSSRAETWGASSLGAVRAVECAPSGMVGSGVIFRLFRMNALASDAEVAVSVNPLHGFRAESLALVDLRSYTSALYRAGVIGYDRRASLMDNLRDIHFLERTTEAVKAALGSVVLPPHLSVESIPDRGPKRADAVRALLRFRRRGPESDRQAPAVRAARQHVIRNGSSPITSPLNAEERREFAQWVLGSGLYQKYLWPILLRSGVIGLGSGRVDPYALRDWAGEALSALVKKEEMFVQFLLDEMDFLDDLTAEIVVWRASVRAERRGQPQAADLEYTREEIAVRHGFENWSELVADSPGMVHNAIPFAIVLRAVYTRAAAVSTARQL